MIKYAGIEFSNASSQWEARPAAWTKKKPREFDQIHSNNTSKWSGAFALTARNNICFLMEDHLKTLKTRLTFSGLDLRFYARQQSIS
jgi:hypothetical protein